jgi:hypothetical protein
MNRFRSPSLTLMVVLFISENAFAETLDTSGLRDAMLAMPEWFYWAFVAAAFLGTTVAGILIAGSRPKNKDGS